MPPTTARWSAKRSSRYRLLGREQRRLDKAPLGVGQLGIRRHCRWKEEFCDGGADL
jgi:hypothetical protein